MSLLAVIKKVPEEFEKQIESAATRAQLRLHKDFHIVISHPAALQTISSIMVEELIKEFGDESITKELLLKLLSVNEQNPSTEELSK
jgi:DNA-binding GntR family transcriptional regulator